MNKEQFSSESPIPDWIPEKIEIDLTTLERSPVIPPSKTESPSRVNFPVREISLEEKVVTIESAEQLSSLSRPYLKRILSEAGVRRIGRNYLRSDFFAFFECRSAILHEPRKPFENQWQRMARINREWRAYRLSPR